MTQFLDGPAEGATLFMKRAPLYLRAVRDPDGKWDALDRLDDAPAAGEEIAVYRRAGATTTMHIRGGRRSGGCGFFKGGEYRLVEPAPQDADVRGTAAWRAWCQVQ